MKRNTKIQRVIADDENFEIQFRFHKYVENFLVANGLKFENASTISCRVSLERLLYGVHATLTSIIVIRRNRYFFTQPV